MAVDLVARVELKAARLELGNSLMLTSALKLGYAPDAAGFEPRMDRYAQTGDSMDRFILRETIKRFQEMLAEDLSEEERKYAAAEVTSMQGKLALLDAAYLGAQEYPDQIGEPSPIDQKLFQSLLRTSADALLVIDPRPGLRIVDMTPAFEAITLTDRRRAIGESIFDIYPDNPALPNADGVHNVFNSFRTVAARGDANAMDVQRYDVRDANGEFVERYWRPLHMPLFNAKSELVWLVTRLEDVTDQFR
jgi:PAS domain-containing protein